MSQLQHFAAPAKLNLFLHITERRADGYHLLQSVFQLIDLADDIAIAINNSGHITRIGDSPIPAEQDLTIRAAHLLKAHTGCALGAEIRITKKIPMGAGLGGGSSDAATVLIALNHLWQTGLSRQALMALGLKLGADVPFFIFGQTAWVEGIGEKIQPYPLPAWHYLLLKPADSVPTAKIFSDNQLTRDSKPLKIATFSQLADFSALRNDMQPVACRLYPDIQFCIDWLNQYGNAKMSGSGSTVFVGFEHAEDCKKTYWAANNASDLKAKNIAVYAASGLVQHPHNNLIEHDF